MRHFWKCQDCAHVFADGEGSTVRDHLGVTDPFPVYVNFTACPECACMDLDKFVPCATDDCDREALKGSDYCLECDTKIADNL